MMTGDAKSIFIDTNILVYANIVSSPFHDAAKSTIEAYSAENVTLWISRQIIREYLTVVTRPQSFSNPLSAKEATKQIQSFMTQFSVADENAIVTEHLLNLLQQTSTAGKQVHDANIVATMLTYNIDALLTYNTADFTRFSDYITLLSLKSMS